MQAFFETYDLKLSVCFTISLINSFYYVLALSKSLWNRAILLTIFKLSNIFYQSSDLRFSMLCFNCCSGFLNGSSGALYVVAGPALGAYGDCKSALAYYYWFCIIKLSCCWVISFPFTELARYITVNVGWTVYVDGLATGGFVRRDIY